MSIQVFYHAKCMDGYSAACVLSQKLPEGTTFSELQHGSVPNVVEGNDVVFIDICPTYEILKDVLDMGNKVYLFDHHNTAIQTVMGLVNEGYGNDNFGYFLDQTRCGTAIAYSIDSWNSVRKVSHVVTDTLISNLSGVLDIEDVAGKNDGTDLYIKLIDVRDRWVLGKDKEDADALSTYLHSVGFGQSENRVKFDGACIMNLDYVDLYEKINVGKELLNEAKLRAQEVIDRGVKFDVISHNDKRVLVCLSEVDNEGVSLAGSSYYSQYIDVPAIFVGVIRNEDGSTTFSTRSNGIIAASKFCERAVELKLAGSGGGHLQAAGCKLDIPCEDTVKAMGIVIEIITNMDI